MSADPTTPKTRIITLTDRPPVRIREDEWPEIASATGDSWDGPFDPARHNQALMRGELDRYSLRVRQHNDGRRMLVYGVVTPGIAPRGQGHDRRGGRLLKRHDVRPPYTEAGAAALVQAIRRVGAELEIPDRIIRGCIADMPPEEL